MEQGAGKEGRLEMKVTGIAGIQCAILLMVLLAEIAFTGGYHTISDSMEQDAGVWEECASDIQEKSVSDMSDESISGMQDQEEIALQNGDYAEALEMLKGKAEVLDDLNFDGYPDIEIYNSEKSERSYFLWDEAESQFVRAIIPAEETKGISIEKKLDEFKTFWGYGDVRDDDYRLLEMTEKLYQWDDIVLKEVRSISCRFEEEEVMITLTDAESGECFGEGTFAVKGWETNSEVRELYARFYQGYAPKELYYMRYDAPGEEQVIPESLVKELLRACEEDAEIELLESLETGRELSDSEKETEAAKSADIAQAMEDMDSAHVKMIWADLDNDGVEDIYAEVDFGGTGEYGEYVLYQGDEAGAYKETGLGTEEHVRKPFYVICWEGKNYVCHHRADAGKLVWNGLILEGYQGGELVETVSFNWVPEKQTDSFIFCQDGYCDMVQKEMEKAPKIYDRATKFLESEGDAEQRDEAENYIFVSDIDNDGTVEKYEKQLHDHYGIGYFGVEMEDRAAIGAKELIIPDCRDESGREIMMWVDACDGKNIMNVMYETGGLDSYMVEGFLLDDAGGCSDLYAIERKTELEVETVQTWELPGKRSRIP